MGHGGLLQMHSVNVLVTDRSPEPAEHINSLLRNSGIKIHVIHARTSSDVKRALDSDSPVLILYADPEPDDASLEEISELANAFDVPLALFNNLQEPESLAEALSNTAAFVINSESDGLLAEAVARLVKRSELDQNQVQQQQQREELEHRYNLLLDSSRDAIAYIHEGLHVYTNRAYLEALRVTNEDEIAGLSMLDMLKAGEINLKELFKGLSKGKFPNDVLDVDFVRPDGSEFEASLTFSPSRFNGEECVQMMVQKRDIAANLEAELERLRSTDPLTQLGNRKAFTGWLEEFISNDASQGTSAAAVIYLEPDGFTEIQEEWDAESADAFLIDLATVIKSCLRNDDRAARIGDQGFALLVQRPDNEKLEEAAQNVLKTYRGHMVEIGDRAVSSSCSLGMVGTGRQPASPVEIISRARKACAEAAEKGDSLVIFRPKLTAVESGDDDPQWIDRIKYALSNQDFYTVQQSIVDLDGEGERLTENMTYLREETGDHSPATYLQIADRNDLAGAIDRHVIPGLLKTFVESDERQIINLSNNSILDYAFPGWFADQLKANCIDGKRIILQIEARSAQTNLKPAQRLLKELKPLGCHLAISRFNAERRSGQILEHLDVSYVKIHPDLCDDLTADTKNQEAIRKIVEVAEAHSASVIADEVADTSSLAVLWQCGVKLIAGAFLNESSQVIAQ
jgi:diguanylate cyclase (GGDEF)-like protein/PAS domain S-box-containing protein